MYDLYRYELLENQGQEHTLNGTPPPLPARQNYQVGNAAKMNACTPKKDKDHYVAGKNHDNVRHNNHLHNHDLKESNYVSPRVIQDSIRHDNYQRLESVHRSQDHASSNYVKLQKEKYEPKLENIYTTQRELHNKGEGKIINFEYLYD